jgi:hypothetical protein
VPVRPNGSIRWVDPLATVSGGWTGRRGAHGELQRARGCWDFRTNIKWSNLRLEELNIAPFLLSHLPFLNHHRHHHLEASERSARNRVLGRLIAAFASGPKKRSKEWPLLAGLQRLIRLLQCLATDDSEKMMCR